MSIQVVKKLASLEFTNHKTEKPTVNFVKLDSPKPDNGHLLLLYSSLIAPKSVPFIRSQTEKLRPELVCKLDWHFGVCAHPKDWDYDWQEELRAEHSIAVQIVIEIPNDVEFTEIYSDMMGLQPLNQTSERKPDWLRVATDIGATVAPLKVLGKVLESLGTEREKTIAANEACRLARRFVMARYIDKKGRRGIEWILSKDVVADWGTLLRGSVYLAFYGTSRGHEKQHQVGIEVARPHAKITLSTRLGFLDDRFLCYIPEDQHEESTCVVDVKLTDPVPCKPAGNNQ